MATNTETFKVAGISHYKDDIIKNFASEIDDGEFDYETSSVELIPEPENKYDPNESPDKVSSIKFHIFRFCFDICINILLFVYILLIINKALPFDSFVKDLIYILLCLIIEMFFTINS